MSNQKDNEIIIRAARSAVKDLDISNLVSSRAVIRDLLKGNSPPEGYVPSWWSSRPRGLQELLIYYRQNDSWKAIKAKTDSLAPQVSTERANLEFIKSNAYLLLCLAQDLNTRYSIKSWEISLPGKKPYRIKISPATALVIAANQPFYGLETPTSEHVF